MENNKAKAYIAISKGDFVLGYFKNKKRSKAVYQAHLLEKKLYDSGDTWGIEDYPNLYRCPTLDDEDFEVLNINIMRKEELGILRKHNLVMETNEEGEKYDDEEVLFLRK